MKKIFWVLVALFTLCGTSLAQVNTENKTPIDFIYIHGADQGTVEEFEIWIDRMHPNMKKNLEASQFVQEHLLKNSYILPDKDMLYWADKAQKDKNIVEAGLSLSKKVSSCIAQLTRTTLAHLLHDAIWLQKYSNMTPILDELNERVKANAKMGRKTALVGYSAGTFITYQYLLHKERSIDAVELFEKFKKEFNLDDQDIAVLKQSKPNKTCISAILDTKIAILSANRDLVVNINKNELRENFKKLNQTTEQSCAPTNAISGILNFGSPIVIFYSDNALNVTDLISYIDTQFFRHIIENNMFFLTVNYKKDPFGVPMQNYTITQMLTYDKNIKQNGGFIYDTAVNGGVVFFASHLKYWDQTNHFTKAVAKSYEEGYKYFYEINN